MISQSAEYCLRAVVCLAMAPGRALTTRQIARAAHVPVGYLAKILGALARAGIVASRRGTHGGHTLGRNPQELSMLDVVQIVDPSSRIRQCPLGLGARGTSLCSLHRQLDRAIAQAEQALRSVTVADLLAETAFGCGRCDRE